MLDILTHAIAIISLPTALGQFGVGNDVASGAMRKITAACRTERPVPGERLRDAQGRGMGNESIAEKM